MKHSYINTKCPTCGKGMRIPVTGEGKLQLQIDKGLFRTAKPYLTGRELLELAGKLPPESFAVYQKVKGGHPLRINLTDEAFVGDDLHNRFVTLELGMTGG